MNISPVETPFISNAGKSTAIQTLHEWQTDALEAAAANAQVEGHTYGLDTRAPTVKLQNYTQITAKAVGVTGTDQAVSNWGRGQELAYQMAKVGRFFAHYKFGELLGTPSGTISIQAI